jgi:predicted RNase H-like nuclease
VNGTRLLGLDLAWSEKNPSGAAAIDAAGRLLDVRADLRGDDEILAWVRAWRGERGVIGIDMPTIVRNPTGMRECERDLSAEFRKQHAGTHPANLVRFPDGGRARKLIDALAADGVVEDTSIAPNDARTIAIEVFPHPAHVRLFGLPTVFKYKKKSRPWPEVLAEWERYRAALASLHAADPPLVLDERIPERVTRVRYKPWDDTLDAITCAYVASFVHRWGSVQPHVRVFGNLLDGYIIVPDRAVFRAEASGVPPGP